MQVQTDEGEDLLQARGQGAAAALGVQIDKTAR
jgi:hypothetical protein